jgi:hypothetical protein
MPSVLAYLESAYVDNTTLALFLLGALFLARLAIERRPVEAPLAIAAFALMVGVKLTTAGLVALAALAVAVLVSRSPVPWPTRRLVLLACLAVAVAGAPAYLRAWVEQGSPFYPFRIAFGGWVLSEGSRDTGRVAELMLGDERYHLPGPAAFWSYFLARPAGGGSFVNPGPGMLVFAPLPLRSTWRISSPERCTAATNPATFPTGLALTRSITSPGCNPERLARPSTSATMTPVLASGRRNWSMTAGLTFNTVNPRSAPGFCNTVRFRSGRSGAVARATEVWRSFPPRM